jgi:hypothetical protein
MNAPSPSSTGSETQLPLVIGVTGHRNLEESDLKELRNKVRGIIAEIRHDFPQTPLLLLSALADGADRLVAEVALEERIPIIAPLPMPRSLYESDFSGSWRQEFSDWLNHKVRCWFELHLVEGNTEDQIVNSGPARNRQYALAGEYIARHSQVLLVLWDGRPGEEGGTQQVFAYKKEGFPILPGSPRLSRLESVEASLVYHIITPRHGEPRPSNALQVQKICTAEEDEADRAPGRTPAHSHGTFRRIFTPVERFNRDGERFAAAVELLREQSRLYLLGDKRSSWPNSLADGPVESTKGGAVSLGIQPLIDRYTLADSLALYFQRRMFRSLWTLYILIFVAMIIFEVCAHGLTEQKGVLLGFIALLLGAYAWHWQARRQDDQNRYQDYRALAEGLRVQLFRRLAGLSELVSPVADHYLLKHATDLDWIRNALRTWSSSWSFTQAHGHITVAEPPPADLAFVRTHWLQHQLRFFEGRSERFQQREEQLHFWSKHSVSVFIMLIVVAVVAVWIFHAHTEKGVELKVALLVVSALLLTTALMHEYISRLALAEHAKTYRRMAALFRKADQLLEEYIQANALDAAREVIQRLGREALVENGDWLLLHRDRPMNVPVG